MKAQIIKISLTLLSFTLGLVFLYSGYTKLHPIEPFEYTFVDIGIAGWRTAPFIARFLIGLEFFIAALLMANIYIKKFTAKLTIFSLIIFSIYLVIILITNGNNGNCGCFGNALAMTPLQALIKNVVMIGLAILLQKFHDGFNFKKLNIWLLSLAIVGSFSLPHILNYIDFNYSEAYLTKKEDQFKLELDSLYKDATINVPPQKLRTGKHIIAFMSMSCQHCRIAAKKLRLIKQKNNNISIYFVLNGDKNKIEPFFKDTKATNIDYCILNGKNFIYLAGMNLPAIFMTNNSNVEHWVDYFYLDQSEIEKWLAKP